ncbi:hypothetical protein [Aquimarina sediminis]|uniref:hypothetical protein n=1 Tax=Aquimarina sediminis TaxID=2070536 RepID=UPI000CA083E1|nr:hypothetical protein [Aquimarina sediminis]
MVFISLKIGNTGAISFTSPVNDTRENLSTWYLQVTDNFKKGRLGLGYGLHYSINRWNYIDGREVENSIEIERENKSFGLATNIYFQLGKLSFVGVEYQPSFYRVDPTTDFEYEHFVSLNFTWKFSLRGKKSIIN